MPLSVFGFQVSLELTNILPIRQAAAALAGQSIEQVLKLARQLKNSGSDILVETDLAAIFGRVWIDDAIVRRFKYEVVRNTQIIEIPNRSLVPSKGAGPTLSHAFANSEAGNLATVIQLSLLCATHDRLSLASALSYGINKRLELGIPGSQPSPGFDGIAGTLEALSSQACSFKWFQYIELVRDKLFPVLHWTNASVGLPSNLLFACMDSLCIIQRWPEEYTLTVSNSQGCVTLIIWAHYLLGLPVLFRGTDKQDIYFRSDSTVIPTVIIHGAPPSSAGPEICLLGKDKEISLRIDRSPDYMKIEAKERLSLAGYLTVRMCRSFQEPLSWAKSQEFEDAVHFSAALALWLSKNIYRSSKDNPIDIKLWQIWDAVDVLFDNFPMDKELVEKYARNLPTIITLKELSLDAFPAALRARIMKNVISMATFVVTATEILVMSTVVGISSCRNLQLVADHDFEYHSTLKDKFTFTKPPFLLDPGDFYDHVSWRLHGHNYANEDGTWEKESRDEFLASDYGWTVYLPTFGAGDCDPSNVDAEKLYIREGVPTDKKTGERRSRARDATSQTIEFLGSHGFSGNPKSAVIDNEVPTYKPRCVSRVTERHEFYGTRKDCFDLMIKYSGIHIEPTLENGQTRTFIVQQAYRSFHHHLWHTRRIQYCEHATKKQNNTLQDLKMSIDTATAAGNWSWHTAERPNRKNEIRHLSERIIILLVSGDPRARWLAVGVAADALEIRNTMLRGVDCCEECAVNAAVERPGKWFVVI